MKPNFQNFRKRNRIFFFVTSCFLLFSCTNQNRNTTKQELEKYLQAEMKKQQIPGLSYAIVLDGEIIDSGALGLANIGLKVPATLNSKFNIGSIGKTFTATSIMLLQRDGKLSINDPVNKYFDSLPANWNTITIKHLLNHTSGIRDYCQDHPGYPLIGGATGEGLEERKKEISELQFIKLVTTDPLNFTPGERFAYSNSNYFLLGFIIQKVSGQSLSEFMNERLFTPAGMTETMRENVPVIVPDRATGYNLNDSNKLINGAYISNFYSSQGDMGIITTAKDLTKWIIALEGGKILDKESLRQMWTPCKLKSGFEPMDAYGSYSYGYSYGLGWELNCHNGYIEIGHGGDFMNGFSAKFVHFPEKKLTVVVLTNLQPWKISQPGVDVYKMAGFYVPELNAIDQFQTASTADSSLNSVVSNFYNTLKSEGEFDTSVVTLNFKERTNPNVEKLLTEHLSNNSPNIDVSCIKTELLEKRNLVRWGVPVKKINYYKIIEENQTPIYMAIYFSADNKIADISY
ncbi:serine hydrolase domain-containing protein [Lacibacter sp. H375]|uniref:serine hydrolase domain-containing protein n=1 Tax=Lacibacter sp. H375 TaxID=3133424 RepID=UPI0030C328C3